MNKVQILFLMKAYELNDISLAELFKIACEDAYVVRCESDSHPLTQMRVRSRNLATPLTAMLLNLGELIGVDLKSE